MGTMKTALETKNRLWQEYETYLIPVIFVMLVVFRNIDMSIIVPYAMVWILSILLYYRNWNIISEIVNGSKATIGNIFIVMSLIVIGINSAHGIIVRNYGIEWVWYFFVPYATLLDGIIIYKKNREAFIKAMRVLNFIIFATAILGVVEHIYYAYFLMKSNHRITTVYSNTFMHGTLCLFALFLPEFTKKRKMVVFCKALYIYNIVFTLSRNTWLSLVIIMLIHTAFFWKTIWDKTKNVLRKRALFIMLFAGALLVLTSLLLFRVGLFNSILDRFVIDKQGTSYSVRATYAKYFFEDMLPAFSKIDLLIGNGNRTSRVSIAGSDVLIKEYEAFDNMYLTTAYEYGMLGLLVVGIVIFRAIFVLMKSEKESFLISEANIPYSFSLLVLSAVIPAFFFELYDWHSVMTVLTWGWAVVLVEYNERVAKER